MFALLEISNLYQGQLRFVSDDDFFRINSGEESKLSEDLHIINQDEAMEICSRVAQRYELSVTPEAAVRLGELFDESTPITPSFTPPFELKKFQKRACNLLGGQDVAFIQSDAGTGKTCMGAYLIAKAIDDDLVDKAVVFCPVALVNDWVRESKTLTSISSAAPKKSWGAAKRKEFYETNQDRIWVLNYEKVRTQDFDVIAKVLEKQRVIFVFDEVQKIGNRKSQLSKRMATLVKKPQYAMRVALTATPIVRGPENFYNEYRVIDSAKFGNVKDFERDFTFANGEKDMWGNYIGYKALETMHLRVGHQMFSASKTRPEIAREFPQKQELLLEYHLSDKERKLYNEIYEYGLSLPKDVRQGALFMMTFMRLCNMPEVLLIPHQYSDGFYGEQLKEIDNICQRHAGAIANSSNCTKLELVIEKVDELMSAGEKLIIFGQHTHNLLFPLAKHLEKYSPLLFTGEQSVQQKEDVKHLFKNTDRNLLLMSDAGQVGLNFQECRYLLHYQTPTSHAAYEQRSDRCLSGDSIIYTPDGFIEMKDIKIGDRVIDAYGNITIVKDAWSSTNDSECVSLSIWGGYNELKCTSDHLILSDDNKWIEARCATKGTWTYSCNPVTGANNNKEFIELLPFEQTCSKKNIDPNGGRYTHPWLINCGDSIELTKEFGFMIGYYIGDGYIAQERCVRFAYNPKTHKANDVARIGRFIESSFGLHFNMIDRDACQGEAYSYSSHLAKTMLHWFGTGCRNKRIPDWIWESNNIDFLSGIFDGLVASDGYVRVEGRTIEYITVNDRVAVFVWWLMRRLGYRPSVRWANAASSFVVGCHPDPQNKRVRIGRIKKMNKLEYPLETVYDITTESGSFVANGIPVHNCHRISSEFDSVTIIRMVGLDTIEVRVEDTMQGRKAMAQQMGFAGEYEEYGAITQSDADFFCGF